MNMSDGCNHDCSNCSQNCDSRNEIAKEKPLEGCKINKVIAVVSGKGGVGKSLVTGLLASAMNKNVLVMTATTSTSRARACQRTNVMYSIVPAAMESGGHLHFHCSATVSTPDAISASPQRFSAGGLAHA